MTHKTLDGVATKLAVSLLRHTDIIPADKAFYEAGMMCKVGMCDRPGLGPSKLTMSSSGYLEFLVFKFYPGNWDQYSSNFNHALNLVRGSLGLVVTFICQFFGDREDVQSNHIYFIHA